MRDKIIFDTSCLPDASINDMDFVDSSFFSIKPGRRLPTPAEVTNRSEDFETTPKPAPIIFEELDLIVKFGPCVAVEEALCLRLVRKYLAGKVPVPEVYGWRVEGSCVFIYMELIRGETLHSRWSSLGASDRELICEQLVEIFSCLRRVEQDPADSFIGSITCQNLGDIVFEGSPGGPFKSIKEFNDWFSALPQKSLSDSQKYTDPYRGFLSDTGTIKFTHGDLHRDNIIISLTSPPRVLALVDWAHAGWYPDYWEYCKSLYTSSYDDEWRDTWIPKLLTPHPTEFDVFAEYVMQMGAV